MGRLLPDLRVIQLHEPTVAHKRVVIIEPTHAVKPKLRTVQIAKRTLHTTRGKQRIFQDACEVFERSKTPPHIRLFNSYSAIPKSEARQRKMGMSGPTGLVTASPTTLRRVPELVEEEEEEISPNLPNIVQNEMIARRLSMQDTTRGTGFRVRKKPTIRAEGGNERSSGYGQSTKPSAVKQAPVMDFDGLPARLSAGGGFFGGSGFARRRKNVFIKPLPSSSFERQTWKKLTTEPESPESPANIGTYDLPTTVIRPKPLTPSPPLPDLAYVVGLTIGSQQVQLPKEWQPTFRPELPTVVRRIKPQPVISNSSPGPTPKLPSSQQSTPNSSRKRRSKSEILIRNQQTLKVLTRSLLAALKSEKVRLNTTLQQNF